MKIFGGLKGDKLKVTPKGYPKDHRQIQLLRYKDFIVSKNVHEEELQTGKFLITPMIYTTKWQVLFFICEKQSNNHKILYST